MSETSAQPYLLKFWYRPGTVVRSLLDEQKGHGLAVFIGALFGVVQSMRTYLASEAPASSTLLLGAVAGLIGLALFSWLLRNFGRWFGGQATVKAARTGLGLGLIPWAVLFAALIPILQKSEDGAALAQYYPMFFIFFIYGYFVLLMALSAALNLSVIKTFLCLVVTILVSLFPLTLVMQLIVGTPQ